MKVVLIGILLLFCAGSHALAQTTTTSPPEKTTEPIKIAVFVAPPFIEKSGDSYTGFTWELWQQISGDLKLPYQVQEARTVAELLQLVQDGRIDVAVTNLSITAARYQTVDFSQPYFDAGQRIMIDERRGHSIAGFLADLREWGHLRNYAWIGVFIIVGTIVLTLIDRRWHPEFPRKWSEGLAESFYHVMSVVTSGSTSHKNLLGPLGTILGAFWLLCGVAVVAYVTSSITAVMTVRNITHVINSFDDLRGKHVGVLTGTVGEAFCRQALLDTQSFTSMDDAVHALLAGEISAIVRDAPVLEWYDNAHPELPITVVGPVFKTEKYGFALPQNSPLTRQISEAILHLKDTGALDTLQAKYFGTTR